MGKMLAIVLAADLLVFPFAASAADSGSQPAQNQQVPPVAQTLVREGDFAVKLAAELDLGSPTTEANAEDILSVNGVAPQNGWLSDYPVTPQILGQLQTSIAQAAADGKLPMTAEQATKGLYSLAAQMNLPTPAGSEAVAEPQGQVPSDQANQTAVNNYYYNEGPPIVTYYAPPPNYMYLYDYVPYPVWWFGFWFPGFYMCHSFHTVVGFGPYGFPGHRFFGHGHVWSRNIVSNHVIDPVTRRSATVDPTVRTGSNSNRPGTMLRNGGGQTFRNVGEMRSETHFAGSPARNSGTSAFRSADARRSAQAIFSRSMQRNDSAGSVREGSSLSRSSQRSGSQSGSTASRSSSYIRQGTPSGSNHTTYARSYSSSPSTGAHNSSTVRSFSPGSSSRSMGAPATRSSGGGFSGGHGSSGGFSGGRGSGGGGGHGGGHGR